MRDNEDLLLRVLHLKQRLSGFSFAIALPFGIGDTVYTIEETKNEFYEVCEDKLYGMEIGKDSSGVMNVVFCLEYDGYFELKDIGRTLFRYESDARKRCSDLNKKET